MSSIKALDPAATTGSVQPILQALQQKIGRVPNMYRVMANSPAVLAAYTNYSDNLSAGQLDKQLAELIAVAAAEHNRCSYCLSAHTATGRRNGLSPEELVEGRQFHSDNPAFAAALVFAHKMLQAPTSLSPADLDELHTVGFSDAAVLEIIAHVVRNMFTNFVNVVADTELDWTHPVYPLTANVNSTEPVLT